MHDITALINSVTFCYIYIFRLNQGYVRRTILDMDNLKKSHEEDADRLETIRARRIIEREDKQYAPKNLFKLDSKI